MQLKDGSILQNGKYRIIRVLGQGGFGITYLAKNTFFDKMIAIKEFFPKDFCGRDNRSCLTLGTQNNAETVEKLKSRFLKEAKNIAKLDHPGIVKIHDIFEENNTAYYVMDYIEGESLLEMVKRNGPLSEPKAIEYINKVGDALEYIHSCQMTHFDVKPGNIMVRKSDDSPILIDFGFSKQYGIRGEATSTLLQGVSHGFSPIELYNQESCSSFSPQSDVYSLGATLFYLIADNIPPSPFQIMSDGLTINSNINVSTVDVIKATMAVKKSDRPQTIKSFLEKLDSIGYTGAGVAEENDVTQILNAKKPQIESFYIKAPAPYYIGDEVEVCWIVKDCDYIILDGRKFYTESGSVIYKMYYAGKMLSKLTAIKGDVEISKNVEFEALDIEEKYRKEASQLNLEFNTVNPSLEFLLGIVACIASYLLWLWDRRGPWTWNEVLSFLIVPPYLGCIIYVGVLLPHTIIAANRKKKRWINNNPDDPRRKYF